jgi:hypothetical protein
MRKNLMRVGGRYIMQRGPTRRPLEITLLAKDVPSEMGNRVMVRIEGGTGKGKEVEAPSNSISPLPGSEPVKPPPKRRPEPEQVQEAPPGWVPSRREQVTWQQTLAIPMTVIDVNPHTGVAVVEGKVFGTVNRYDAPISQLCPIEPTFTPVDELPVQRSSVVVFARDPASQQVRREAAIARRRGVDRPPHFRAAVDRLLSKQVRSAEGARGCRGAVAARA